MHIKTAKSVRPAEKLTIGRLAKATQVGVETIRYYERRGLIEQPRHSGGSFRVYPENTKSRIHFIRRAKELGFTLKEISELLDLAADPAGDRSTIKDYAIQKIASIEDKIRDLAAIQATLAKLAKACSGSGSLHGCPIMESLQTNPEPSSPCGGHHE
ncbi:MAG: MerR family transcriptional regulator [Planctomycetaceae bacterium]